MASRRWMFVALYATVAVACGYMDFRMRQYPDIPWKDFMPSVVDGTAEAPGLYRVFTPLTTTWFIRATGLAPVEGWLLSRLLWFMACLLAFDWYLRTWYSDVASFGGTLFVAATLPLTFTNSWAIPDQLPELAFFALGAGAIARGRDGWFAAWLTLAAFNRETAVFLVLLYAVARPLTAAHAARTAAFGALWFGIYAGLRAWRGLQSYDYWQIWRNIRFLGLLPPGFDPYKRAYAWFVIALFGPPAAVIWARWDAVPPFARRALLVVPAVLAVATVFSSIIETRIFTPLYALMLPAVVAALGGTEARAS
jgi:hypothetical protein